MTDFLCKSINYAVSEHRIKAKEWSSIMSVDLLFRINIFLVSSYHLCKFV